MLGRALDERAGHRSAAAQIETQARNCRAVFFHCGNKVMHERRGATRPRDMLAINKLDGLGCFEMQLKNAAATGKHRRDESMVETGRVVERRRHPHHVIGSKVQISGVGAFRE